ncbi:hypothetical protein Scep_026288 [Stephania cephalantha]|uniref:Uncharacterized protein n=1 Tax=Stephania cephalantha TaxID=152367 RepID=A0AAP0EK95_9MAGN
MNSDPWYYAYHYSQPPLVERLGCAWGSLKRKKLKSSLIKKLIDLRRCESCISQLQNLSKVQTLALTRAVTLSHQLSRSPQPVRPHCLTASPPHRQCRRPLQLSRLASAVRAAMSSPSPSSSRARLSPLKSKPSPVPSPSPPGLSRSLCSAASPPHRRVVASPGSRGLASAVQVVRRAVTLSPPALALASPLSSRGLASAVWLCRHLSSRLSRSPLPLSSPNPRASPSVSSPLRSRGLACCCAGRVVTLPPALASASQVQTLTASPVSAVGASPYPALASACAVTPLQSPTLASSSQPLPYKIKTLCSNRASATVSRAPAPLSAAAQLTTSRASVTLVGSVVEGFFK